ncbi:MAG: hypothetical protein ABR505_06085 [Actinomycetota bacterium]
MNPASLLGSPLLGVSAATFAALSALRRNRVFHPVGEAYMASLQVLAGDRLGIPNGAHRAVVRFSRGAGLPEPLPDVLGLAIKIPAYGRDSSDQDFLLASSAGSPLTRNLLVPTRSFFTCTYSSVLPYRIGDDNIVVGARAVEGLARRRGDFGGLRSAADQEELHFDLLIASMAGAWEPIGSLHVQEQCSQQVSRGLRFNPWNTNQALQPAGVLNRMRRAAYTASQEARPD